MADAIGHLRRSALRSLKMIFDLAQPENWLKIAESVANILLSKEEIERIKAADPELLYHDTMSYISDCNISYCSKEFLDTLYREFNRTYSRIRIFHSCRPIGGIGKYKEKGILVFSEDLFLELALEAFSGYRSENEIVSVVRDEKIHDFERGVYAFLTIKEAVDDSCSHYLQSGSENLQGIAHKLNLGSRGYLADRSKAFIIECIIPIEIVSEGYRNELWRMVFTEYAKQRDIKLTHYAVPHFCIRTKENVSPEEIISFHQIDDTIINSHAPRH